MIKKITLKNYKPILDLELDLGKFKVLLVRMGRGRLIYWRRLGWLLRRKIIERVLKNYQTWE